MIPPLEGPGLGPATSPEQVGAEKQRGSLFGRLKRSASAEETRLGKGGCSCADDGSGRMCVIGRSLTLSYSFSSNSLLLGFYLRKRKSWPPSLSAPLNSVACGLALWPGSVSGSCPCLGRARELCGRALWPGLVLLLSCSSRVFSCGRTISDVDADKNH